ncbi:unnamed protein product [Oppiella nova]|uniref:Uncharacterized protein n=1 Tax=Oppiella nova TaxID=334625 RepID=A0A7R9LK74_9ACAR|nr:unnamed protein product [Oppiella nova]CAG2164413.1 unnamed protein product [Oppiella nova]
MSNLILNYRIKLVTTLQERNILGRGSAIYSDNITSIMCFLIVQNGFGHFKSYSTDSHCFEQIMAEMYIHSAFGALLMDSSCDGIDCWTKGPGVAGGGGRAATPPAPPSPPIAPTASFITISLTLCSILSTPSTDKLVIDFDRTHWKST